jgi:hypothetical protein
MLDFCRYCVNFRQMNSNNSCCFISLNTSSSSAIPHQVVCLAIGRQRLPNRDLHWVWSNSSSLKFQYLIFPSHPVVAYHFFHVFPSLLPSTYYSMICFRREFLRRTWPIQLAQVFQHGRNKAKYLFSRTLKTTCGASVPGMKRPCREVDHSPPSIATITIQCIGNSKTCKIFRAVLWRKLYFYANTL